MDTPRIGDAVHYVPTLEGTRCLAAITIDTHLGNTEINLAVWTRAGDTYTAYPEYDTDGAHIDADGDTWSTEAGFTPGTWHHIH